VAKKALDERWQTCKYGFSMPHDIASAILVKNRAMGRASSCKYLPRRSDRGYG